MVRPVNPLKQAYKQTVNRLVDLANRRISPGRIANELNALGLKTRRGGYFDRHVVTGILNGLQMDFEPDETDAFRAAPAIRHDAVLWDFSHDNLNIRD